MTSERLKVTLCSGWQQTIKIPSRLEDCKGLNEALVLYIFALMFIIYSHVGKYVTHPVAIMAKKHAKLCKSVPFNGKRSLSLSIWLMFCRSSSYIECLPFRILQCLQNL